jgi:O-antigen biosynthesis protein
MDLSVVIVNYNVRYFLEQCLQSVVKACKQLQAEVIVVDNNSVDGSVEMVREKFPDVRLIANEQNLGFSAANNQGIKVARARYILLLNPDTVVEDDTFAKALAFMDEHPDAGGLGVKMLDGQGRFLPESKRSLPTPSVSFYKIFGLSNLFPTSRVFGKYHLGYLNQDEIHEVEVLSGAFMLLRREALDKTGLLDEAFFMYGEDIDLSYRMIKAGYKNYYFPETRIIHYKGESTKKSSINYVFVFYNAMLIFARKHFSGKNIRLFSLLINLAIYFRAFLAVLNRFVQRIFWPLADGLLIYLGFFYIKNYWEHQVMLASDTYYPPEYMYFFVPAYIALWLLAVYFSGGYDTPLKPFRIVRGVGWGTISILVIYALLPIEWRFSRALILLGSIWALFSMLLSRWVVMLSFGKETSLAQDNGRRVLIAGYAAEAQRIAQLTRHTGDFSFIGIALPQKEEPLPDHYLGGVSQLSEMVSIYKIDEIIFCAASLSSQEIIDHMTRLKDARVDFKIAPPEGMFIIGSNSIDTFDELFTIHMNSIIKPASLRTKRMFDILVSLLLLLPLPFLVLFYKNKFGMAKNIFSVLTGNKSWVGYHPNAPKQSLPPIKPGILYPTDGLKRTELSDMTRGNLNTLYAKDYKVENDLNILIRGYSKLDRQD